MDYKIEAMEILLNEDCIIERYYPLIPYRTTLLKNIKAAGCRFKNECFSLSDEDLLTMGLPSVEMVSLFRRFLCMYDVKESKLKEIESLNLNESEATAFRELFLLPGVKAARAGLYYGAGYTDLKKIAGALPEQIIRDTSEFISRNGLDLKAPLPKEVRTHIAVAKALTGYKLE